MASGVTGLAAYRHLWATLRKSSHLLRQQSQLLGIRQWSSGDEGVAVGTEREAEPRPTQTIPLSLLQMGVGTGKEVGRRKGRQLSKPSPFIQWKREPLIDGPDDGDRRPSVGKCGVAISQGPCVFSLAREMEEHFLTSWFQRSPQKRKLAQKSCALFLLYLGFRWWRICL